jgi:DNA-binding LacI/PurR family transcriptional regulator
MAISVHQRLKDTLIERFQTLPLGSRLPSGRDLGSEFNVAYLTITRVLRDLEHEGYIVRKAKQGTFLASRERPVGSAFDHAPGANGTVVFIHPDYFSYHYWIHLRRAEEAAVKGGLRFAEYKIQSGKVYDRAVAFARTCDDLCGVIALPVPGSLAPAALDQLASLDVPVVLISEELPEPHRPKLFSIDADYFAIGRLAMDTLLDAGHRRITYIEHEPNRSPHMRRGLADAVAARGLPPRTLEILGSGIEAWQDSREAGYELSKRMLDQGTATAAILDSLNGALGLQRAMWERQLSAPSDLSYIAIGNSNGLEEFLTPPVSTIDWNRDEEIRLAYAIITGAVKPKQANFTLPPRLFEQASIATLSPARH